MTNPTGITQEMIRLYDEYTHLTLDRRDFIDKLSRLTGSGAAALALAPLIAANDARAAMVPEDDPRLVAETIDYPGAGATLSGYLVRPKEPDSKLPAVIVIHENRGLNAHIKDVVRRGALEGFLAFGPDFLSSQGGTPADEDKAREMIGALDPATTVAHAAATVAFLKAHERSTGKVGAMGFCWGGGMVNQTAIHSPDLLAGVAFYGRVPAAADVAKIKGRLMLHYAGLDDRINEGIPGYKAALEAAGIGHAIHMYDGVNHAFHNDTSAARYDKAAADLAWSRTIAFLKESLG
ncbi:MAG: dienelactone hydrolase family protein [Pseudomonadota bacterium]|nr:dienelactone hydrolase family protein [Pseudomonadota bacterium]